MCIKNEYSHKSYPEFLVGFGYNSGKFLDYMHDGEVIFVTNKKRVKLLDHKADQSDKDDIYTSELWTIYYQDKQDDMSNTIEDLINLQSILTEKKVSMRVSDKYSQHEYKVNKSIKNNINQTIDFYFELLRELNK